MGARIRIRLAKSAAENKEGGLTVKEKKMMTRSQVLGALAEYGITGEMVYLIDVIPLIEMMWADTRIQPGEREVLNDFLRKHVVRINTAAGTTVLTFEKAQAFVRSFIETRPDPNLLKLLRSFVDVMNDTCLDPVLAKRIKETLLNACLDIAASSVERYPYGIHERFNPAEKQCFFEIIETLEGKANP